MADAEGVLQRGAWTAHLVKESATGFITAPNLETAANRDWADIHGSDKLINGDTNRIQKVTLMSPINETATTETETVDYYGSDTSDTLTSTTDRTVDPIEFTATLDFSRADDAGVKILPGGTDAAVVGTTKYLIALLAVTEDDEHETALVFVGTLTRRTIDPAGSGASTVLFGFTPVNHNIYRVAEA